MRVLKLFIVGLLPLLVSSCGVFVEKDISKESVVLLSPGDGTSNDETTQRFSWEDNEQIDQYRLQIVTTRFDDRKVTFHDTLISGASFSADDLEPQEYEWRVRGETSSENTTDYATRGFRVDLTQDLQSEQVGLLFPEDKRDFDDPVLSVELSWERLIGVTSYEIVVRAVDPVKYPGAGGKFTSVNREIVITSGEGLYKDESITELDDTIEERIFYNWYVIGHNASSSSQQSETRTFSVLTDIKVQ